MFMAFQTKTTPENTFILLIFHVVNLERWKKIKFTANAGFRKNGLSVLCQSLTRGRVTEVLECSVQRPLVRDWILWLKSGKS